MAGLIGIKVRKNWEFAKSDQIMRRMRDAMVTVTKAVKNRTKYNLNGRVLNKRTGNLRDSIRARLEKIPQGVRGIVYTNVVYARIHEVGGITGRNYRTVIPKRPYMRRALVDRKEFIRKRFSKLTARIIIR